MAPAIYAGSPVSVTQHRVRVWVRSGLHLGVAELVEHGRIRLRLSRLMPDTRAVWSRPRVERAVREHDDVVLDARFVSVPGERHGDSSSGDEQERLSRAVSSAPSWRSVRRIEDRRTVTGRGADQQYLPARS